MTLINVQALQVRLGGIVAADATVQLQCWAGDEPAVRVSGSGVVFPALETVKLRAGVPAAPIDYPPTLGTCCVKITVRCASFLLERYVAIPEAGPVDFDDLVDVDPGTFAPSLDAVTAWQAWRDAAEVLAVSASAAAASASTSAADAHADRVAAAASAASADVSRVAAGTSAFNAGGSAAAAQGSENAAAASASSAGTALASTLLAKTDTEKARDEALSALTISQTVGRVVTVWDKINQRPQMIYGDTGRRNITATGSTSTPFASGALILRRVGWTVSLEMVNLVISGQAASTNYVFDGILPVGFRSPAASRLTAAQVVASSGVLTVYGNGSDRIVITPGTTAPLYQTIVWQTVDAWPSSLPGITDGAIPTV